MAGLMKISVAVLVILFLGRREAEACDTLVACTNTYLAAVRGAQSVHTEVCRAAESYVECLTDASIRCESAVQGQIDSMLKSTRNKLKEQNCVSGGAGTVLLPQLGLLLLTLFAVLMSL